MSAFSKASFNAVAYAASRPSYPPQLYSHILTSLHSPLPSNPSSPSTLLDLGCGPGLSTFAFVPSFSRVIGLDPSAGMVRAARGLLEERSFKGEVRFEVGKGEDLSALEAGSVDLAVAGQAAHWFDCPAVYRELLRVLKPGGGFAFWGYGEFFFPRHPKLSALITPYSAGTLGPYWQQPGRSYVEGLLSPLPFPTASPSEFGAWDPTTFKRTYFSLLPSPPSPPSPPSQSSIAISHLPLLLTHHWTLHELESYLRTWSSALTYNETHGGDVVGEFVERLGEEMGCEGIRVGEKVEVGWKMGLMEGRKTA